MFISTILEIVGLGFIFTIIGTLNPANAKTNLFVNKLGAFFELNNTEIFLYLLLFFSLFYIIKVTFIAFYNWFEGNFLHSHKENLSSKLFREYLNQDFNYFYNRNSAEFIRNLISEADNFVLYLVSILKLTLEVVIVIGIFCFLSYINFYFTILITIVFLFFSNLYFFLFKKKLNTWGIQRQSNMKKIIQFMQEGFDGVKVIKLLGREKFFFNKYFIM